jgi:hypothetical protein
MKIELRRNAVIDAPLRISFSHPFFMQFVGC